MRRLLIRLWDRATLDPDIQLQLWVIAIINVAAAGAIANTALALAGSS